MRKTFEDYVVDGIERVKKARSTKTQTTVEKELQLFFSAFPLKIFYGRGFGNSHGSSSYTIDVEEMVSKLNELAKETK